METPKSNPLQCCECEGVLLPERAIPLNSGIWVLRYSALVVNANSFSVKNELAVRIYP